MKNDPETQLKGEPSITCRQIWHVNKLIRHTICECLVKIQQFRQEWSLIMYENTQKRNKTKELSITCSYILIRHAICESLVLNMNGRK